MKLLKLLLISLLIFLPILYQAQVKNIDKQVIVFVHGAWGGGWDYKNMEEILESDGYKVYRPTLNGQGEREHLNSTDVSLDTHIRDVVNVI